MNRIIYVTGILLTSLASVLAADTHALNLAEDAYQITIRQGPNLVLSYNKRPPPVPPGIDPIYRRSGFLHPVASPDGGVVTAAYPADHAHQNGIFAAWVKTKYNDRPVDFWNLAKDEGRVTHDRVTSTSCNAHEAGFVVELKHQITGAFPDSDAPVDILRDTWNVRCYRSNDHYVFDIDSFQQALTDKPLYVQKYHYGGMAFRGPSAWVLQNNQQDADVRPSEFLNSQGSRRSNGNHQAANWVAMTGTRNGQRVTIAALGHKNNFRSPQKARLHPTMPYFCFAPCVDGDFTIDKHHPYRSKYRLIVLDGDPDPKWLDNQWEGWCNDQHR